MNLDWILAVDYFLIELPLTWNIVFVLGVQSDSVTHRFIYLFFFIFTSIIGYSMILNIAPYAIQ